MKHFGDITKLSGYTLPPVDCICGGSPCQDLSVAGLRKGLEGERSGLFMEQIRITKEMRERARRDDRSDDPGRYLVWENVPGAFSSNAGRDFQAVLTEIIRIAEPDAPDVPLPEKGWPKAGLIYDELANWSVAWRTHDSQYFGVPQRRRRISVLADFSGLTAGEIMFDPQYRRTAEDGEPVQTVADSGTKSGCQVCTLGESVPGDPEQSSEEGKETAGTVREGIDRTGEVIGFTNRGCVSGDTAETLRAEPHGAIPMVGGNTGNAVAVDVYNHTITGDIAPTLNASSCNSPTHSGPSVMQSISFQERAGKPGGGKGILIQNEHTGALSTVNNQSVFCIEGHVVDRNTAQNEFGVKEDIAQTLNATDRHAVAYGIDHVMLSGGTTYQGGSVMSESTDVAGTLRAEEHGHQPIVFDGSRRHDYEPLGDIGETVQAHYGTGGGNTPIVVHGVEPAEPICVEMTSTKNTVIEDGVSPTLTARMGTGGNQVNAICMDVGFFQTEEEKAGALLARQYKDPPITYQDKTGALMASGYQKNGTQKAANDMYVTDNLVRRLTPKECERLQAFPDDWTNIGEWTDSKGKKHKDADSPRYKALGNSIALPFWFWLLRRISAQYERPATLGSLFDGIGGFPLCWERCNGRGTAIWASEIEEFPIAVTKLRFPEEE